MTDGMQAEFAAARGSWRPAPHTDTDTVTAYPAGAFAALLDQPLPVATTGDELPPLWHWSLFPAVHRSADLGVDGHPADAAFTPPLAHRRRMFVTGDGTALTVGSERTGIAVSATIT